MDPTPEFKKLSAIVSGVHKPLRFGQRQFMSIAVTPTVPNETPTRLRRKRKKLINKGLSSDVGNKIMEEPNEEEDSQSDRGGTPHETIDIDGFLMGNSSICHTNSVKRDDEEEEEKTPKMISLNVTKLPPRQNSYKDLKHSTSDPWGKLRNRKNGCLKFDIDNVDKKSSSSSSEVL